jgi:hypothetical protein
VSELRNDSLHRADYGFRIIAQTTRAPAESYQAEDNGRPSAAEADRESLDQDTYQLDALATGSSGNNDDCLYGGSSTIACLQHINQPSEQHVEPDLAT